MSSIFTNDVVVEGPVDVTGSSVSVTNFPATQPVTGTVSVNNFPATQPVSGTVTVNGTVTANVGTGTQPVSGTVSVGNVVSVITAVASSAVLTNVIVPATTSTQLLASNASRKSAILFIPKAAVSIAYDTSASATHFTYLTGVASTTIIVTGYTGPIFTFGPAETVNVTELS